MPRWRPMWHSEPVVPGDLSVIMLTLNKPPKHWQKFYKKALLEAIGDMPLVIISKEPMNWQRPNTTYVLQEEPEATERARIHNIYVQLRKAVRLARTPYVAVVNDDCLYSYEHFIMFRPPLNRCSYNYCRWSINEWSRDNPFYYHSPHPDDPMLIAPRDHLLRHMEGVTYFEGHATDFLSDCVVFYSLEPIVSFHHTRGLLGDAIVKWRKPWPVQALTIPKWGAARELIQEWREED